MNGIELTSFRLRLRDALSRFAFLSRHILFYMGLHSVSAEAVDTNHASQRPNLSSMIVSGFTRQFTFDGLEYSPPSFHIAPDNRSCGVKIRLRNLLNQVKSYDVRTGFKFEAFTLDGTLVADAQYIVEGSSYSLGHTIPPRKSKELVLSLGWFGEPAACGTVSTVKLNPTDLKRWNKPLYSAFLASNSETGASPKIAPAHIATQHSVGKLREDAQYNRDNLSGYVLFATDEGSIYRWDLKMAPEKVFSSDLGFRGIAFAPDGVLYGVTEQTLFALNLRKQSYIEIGSLIGPSAYKSIQGSDQWKASGLDISPKGVARIVSADSFEIANVDLSNARVTHWSTPLRGPGGDTARGGIWFTSEYEYFAADGGHRPVYVTTSEQYRDAGSASPSDLQNRDYIRKDLDVRVRFDWLDFNVALSAGPRNRLGGMVYLSAPLGNVPANRLLVFGGKRACALPSKGHCLREQWKEFAIPGEISGATILRPLSIYGANTPATDELRPAFSSQMDNVPTRKKRTFPGNSFVYEEFADRFVPFDRWKYLDRCNDTGLSTSTSPLFVSFFAGLWGSQFTHDMSLAELDSILDLIADSLGLSLTDFKLLSDGRNMFQPVARDYSSISSDAAWTVSSEKNSVFHSVGLSASHVKKLINQGTGEEYVFIAYDEVAGVFIRVDGLNEGTFNLGPKPTSPCHVILDILPWIRWGVGPHDTSSPAERLDLFRAQLPVDAAARLTAIFDIENTDEYSNKHNTIQVLQHDLSVARSQAATLPIDPNLHVRIKSWLESITYGPNDTPDYLYKTETFYNQVSTAWMMSRDRLSRLSKPAAKEVYDEFYASALEYQDQRNFMILGANRAFTNGDRSTAQHFFNVAMRLDQVYGAYARASVDVFNGDLETAYVVAERIYKASKWAAKFGSSVVMGPGAASAVDKVFTVTDFYVTQSEYGTSRAVSDLVVGGLIDVVLDGVVLEELGGKTINGYLTAESVEALGKSQLYALIVTALKSDSTREQFSEFVASSTDFAVSETSALLLSEYTKLISEISNRLMD